MESLICAGGSVGSGKAICITLGSRWADGYRAFFNAELRHKLPNSEILYTLRDAQAVIEWCRQRLSKIRSRTARRGNGLLHPRCRGIA